MMAGRGSESAEAELSDRGPNRVWLSDITYINTDEGWLHLTTTEDMWSRRMVGHAITHNLWTSLPNKKWKGKQRDSKSETHRFRSTLISSIV
jgi:hypothetical protein